MGDVFSTCNSQRARWFVLLAGLLASVVPACSESDATGSIADGSAHDAADAARDAPLADAVDPGAEGGTELDSGSGCYRPDAGAIPEPPAACGAVEACLKEAGACSLTAETLSWDLYACNDCGDVMIGFKAGCATAVVHTRPSPDPSKLNCLEQKIVGHRWACTPAEGWARLWLGSCTLP